MSVQQNQGKTYWDWIQPKNQDLLCLKTVTEPRYVVPDRNTEPNPIGPEGKTKLNPICGDDNTPENNHRTKEYQT